jgi:radical SAM family uncharacterized protein
MARNGKPIWPVLSSGIKRRLRVADGTKLPLIAGHKLLYRCNLACNMCPFWRRDDEELLSVEAEKRLFVKLADSGVLFLGFEGGEPLLRKDLPAILAAAHERFHTSLVSNGLLLERRIDEIARHLDLLFVSLDGEPALHDRLRGLPGAFDRTVRGVEAARGRVPIALNTTLTRSGLDDAPRMVELARSLHVPVNFQVAYDYSHAGPQSPAGPQFRATLEILRELKRQGAPIVNSRAYFDTLLHSWFDGGTRWECKPWLTINIDPAGRIVLPCYTLNEYGGERTVWETDLPELWATYDWDRYRACNRCGLSCYLEPSLFRWTSPELVKHWLLDNTLG